MAHSHHHWHDHHHHGGSNIKLAFFLNLGFTIIEFIGGFWINSVAIMSDALHDLGDSLSLGLAWYFEKLSKKGSDSTFSYGYKRFSLLGAVINSVILLVGSFFILSEAIPRIWNPEAVDAAGMIGFAVLGIIVNGAAFLRLNSDNSINERVVRLHLLEDVLGWVAVLVGGVVLYFFDWPVIDPLLSIGITLFVLYNVIKNLRQSLTILLQGTPPELDTEAIQQRITSIPAVDSIHDLHIWTLDGSYNVLTLHAVVADDLQLHEAENIKQQIRHLLTDVGVQHITIELEVPGYACEHADCGNPNSG
ncbi:cation transporter [Pontibacter sp. Tf4]|uniref:cation diffusion facilitator family transporter n=1 Tax=Pontibacter sp. Tf4 TaxID=2761620 RepID=UPI00162AD091|nr:cation diffusion facilitator family transporter [Pontibacter sp. Tf4]MBB6612592.1 cation transporter [Pontibacter sp. Tf4]